LLLAWLPSSVGTLRSCVCVAVLRLFVRSIVRESEALSRSH